MYFTGISNGSPIFIDALKFYIVLISERIAIIRQRPTDDDIIFMPRWSFNLQIYFLNSRLKQLVEIQKGTETVIQDRTIYEDANIFAPNLHEMGLMSKRDFDNYYHFFQTLKSMVQPPDLLIYLNASVPTLVGQIQKRGREYEENIRLDYLKRLNDYYNKWIDAYKEGPLLVIDIDKIKFGENTEHFGEIIQRVDRELYGLF